MAESKFRFVSPGIQLREIDRSQIPDDPEAVGPVVIGRAERGPALRPVKVQNFTEFVEIFGAPTPGGETNDIWRNGTQGIEPNYGAYAAQAWLANGTPLTYVRLLGKAHTNSTATGANKEGWEIGGGAPNATRAKAGALGLWVIDSGSQTAANLTGTLAAVFYCTGSSVELSGNLVYRSAAKPIPAVVGTNALVESTAAGPTFTAVVKNNAGTVTETINFNVKDETAGNFIRKVFNTDPTRLTSRLHETNSVKSYFLGETFERSVTETLNNGTTAGDVRAFIAPLYSAAETIIWGRNNANAQSARTNWVIGQTSQTEGSYTPEANPQLFQLIALDEGEWSQENIKISIVDVRYSNEPSNPYGTFGVQIRDARDSDEAPIVLESYSNLDLNPKSPNYISARIGDAYAKWDDTDRRYRYHGKYPNNSKYVYVNMYSDGFDSADLLPMGYRGPVRWGSFAITSGSHKASQPGNSHKANGVPVDFNRAMIGISGTQPGRVTTGMAPGTTQPLLNTYDVRFTGSFEFPKTYLRTNTTVGNLNDATDAYFGLDTTKTSNSTRFDLAYQDLVWGLQDEVGRTANGPRTAVSYSAQGNVIQYQDVFSLEDVSYHTASSTSTYTANASQTIEGYYHSGSYKLGNSIASSGSNTYKNVLDADFNQFTIPLFGGFNGTDIRQSDPFNNHYDLTSPDKFNSARWNSIEMAIDSMADPELVECNLLVAPNVGTNTKTRGLTNHMLDTARSRADCLAIIDIDGGYVPPADRSSYGNDDDSANQGKAKTAADNLRSRQINNSYGAAYYPWVQVRDPDSGVAFYSPASVAALGTYAYSQAQSEIWFAPAGFNRGGLTEGSAGIPISGISERLTSKDRDKLYENNINPIASFPAEGLVVFGQKTLQSTRSALDRVNVRRLMIHVKKEVSRISSQLLFDPNTQVTWDRFTGQVRPFLQSVKTRLGLEDFKVVLDKTTTTPDLVDRNVMYAKIFLKPTRAIEFIALDFIITNTGASFDD
jgi:hypothetical protein